MARREDVMKNPTFQLVDPELFGDDSTDEDEEKEQQQEINEFINGQKAKNTKNSTQYSINVLRRYLKSNDISTSVDKMSSTQLNLHLCNFWMKIKKINGNDYEPDCLTTICRGIQRHLEERVGVK